jgi:hypothetical protein
MVEVRERTKADELHVDAYAGLRHWLGFTIEQFASKRQGRRIRESVTRELVRQVSTKRPTGYTQLPRVRADQLSAADFKRKYLIPNQPVVLEGFASNWPALSNWTPDFFRREYGDYQIPVRLNASQVTSTELPGSVVTLAEFVDRMEKGEDIYAQNLQGIFRDNPRLKADIRLDAIKDYLCRFSYWPITSLQLFISNNVARTFYHCASSLNLFTQIHGTKKWHLVAPEHSLGMHMVVRDDTFFLQSLIDWRDTPERQVELGWPLYNYIPKYEAAVGAGDAIFVPQWWWHGVENLGTSIGVSAHGFTNFFAGHKYLAFLGLANKPVWENLGDILRSGSGTDTSLKRVMTVGPKS